MLKNKNNRWSVYQMLFITEIHPIFWTAPQLHHDQLRRMALAVALSRLLERVPPWDGMKKTHFFESPVLIFIQKTGKTENRNLSNQKYK